MTIISSRSCRVNHAPSMSKPVPPIKTCMSAQPGGMSGQPTWTENMPSNDWTGLSRSWKAAVVTLLACAALFNFQRTSAQVDYVDPTIGNVGHLLEPTRPTVSLPNSMVRVYPVRKDGLDVQIHSFPLTIISHRLGELFWLMPGDVSAGAWDQPAAYDQQIETPYYYSARFEDSGIRTEF